MGRARWRSCHLSLDYHGWLPWPSSVPIQGVVVLLRPGDMRALRFRRPSALEGIGAQCDPQCRQGGTQLVGDRLWSYPHDVSDLAIGEAIHARVEEDLTTAFRKTCNGQVEFSFELRALQ